VISSDKTAIYCISVIKKGAIDTFGYNILSFDDDLQKKNHNLNYMPDIRGVSLSGKMVDENTGLPVGLEEISLVFHLKKVKVSVPYLLNQKMMAINIKF